MDGESAATGPGGGTLRRLLWLDIAFELAAGAALLAAFRPIAGWLDIREALVLAGGLVFIAAGALIWLLSKDPVAAGRVRALAFANVVGALAGWFVLMAGWTHFQGEGRWVLGFAADSMLLIGVAELLVLRRRDG